MQDNLKLKIMELYTNYSSYGNDLSLTLEDAKACFHAGDCYKNVERVMQLPYVAKQLEQLTNKNLIAELREYGAWTSEELSIRKDNLRRWVWISAGNILESI